MTLSKSECAKLGSQKSREVSAEIKRKNIERYLQNPKLCKKCGSIISYEKRRNNFCKMSCAASVRNIGRIRCSQNKHNYKDFVKRDLYIKSEKYKLMRYTSTKFRKKSKREVLLSVFGDSCSICDFKKRICIHRKDGTDHKPFWDMSWDEINNVITKDKDQYTSLCYRCHKSTHWCMDILNMSWNDIYDRLTQHL